MKNIQTSLSSHPFLIGFAALYTAGFAVYYIAIQNFEFLWYVAVLVFFFVLIVATLHKTHFSRIILWGLAIWGLLHMAGGGLIVNGKVLYALELIPIFGSGESFILKYDQVVHFFGFAVSTLVVIHLFKMLTGRRLHWFMYILAALAGMGLGVVNEIVEFLAVVSFPDTNVGGYVNTSLDLVFNTLGAFTAGIASLFYDRRKDSLTESKKHLQ